MTKPLEQTVVETAVQAGAGVIPPNIKDTPPMCPVHSVVDKGHRCEKFDESSRALREQRSLPRIQIGELMNWKGLVMRLVVVEESTGQMLFSFVGTTGKHKHGEQPPMAEMLETLRKRIIPGNEEQFMKLMAAVVSNMGVQNMMLQRILASLAQGENAQVTESGNCRHGQAAAACPLCKALKSVAGDRK